MIELRRIIVHQIIKNVSESEATPDLSSSLLIIDQRCIELVEKLNNVYGKNSDIKYGDFENPTIVHFPLAFREYFNNQSDQGFYDLSCSTLLNLARDIQAKSAAKGGYLIYAEYIHLNHQYVGIFLIRNTEGMFFMKDEDTEIYKINPVVHLNLDKFAMACRVDMTRYGADNGKVLSFIKKKLPDIADYFINWIAAKELESAQEYTKALYELTNHLPLPVNENNQILSIEEFRKKLHGFVTASPNKTVNLLNLSKVFYPDEAETYVVDIASGEGLIMNNEFKADSRAMKKFIQINVSGGGINLRFSRGDFENKIILDPEHPGRVIIESDELANAIRTELNQQNES